MLYRIVETDNFGRDYPDEKFINIPSGSKKSMQKIADIINNEICIGGYVPRYWKVVDQDYKLQPGFEP